MLEGDPLIRLPEPDFTFTELERDDQNELAWAKNKYEYARKVRELSRLLDVVPRLSRLAERTANRRIHLVSGLLAAMVERWDEANKHFRSACCPGTWVPFVGLAAVCLARKDWTNCATHLLQCSVHCKDQAVRKDTLIALGRTLGKLQDREVPGLAVLATEGDGADRDLERLVVSYALASRNPEAAAAVFAGDVVGAKSLAPQSLVFAPLARVPPADEPAAPAPHDTKASPAPQRDTETPACTQRIGRVTDVLLRPPQYFGFIRDDASKETFYFDAQYVNHEGLHKQLLGNRAGQRVSFVPSSDIRPGRRYRMAWGVVPYGDEVDPVPEARRPVVALPSTGEPYGRAKHAEARGDFAEAEQAFQEAICHGGRYQSSAILDLASLLHRMARTADAIRALDLHRKLLANPEAADNQKMSFLIAVKDFDGALNIIQALLAQRSLSPAKRLGLQRQQVYSYYQLARYDDALQVLRSLPQDAATLGMIEKVETAKREGKTAGPNGPDLREFEQWAGGTSPLCQHLLDSYDESYLDERSRARGYYDDKDFTQLERMLDGVGRRPSEKGKINLALAVLAARYPAIRGQHAKNSYLQSALTYMGEAALYDHANGDIARAYLAESLTLCLSETHCEWPLTLILASYLPERPPIGSLQKMVITDGKKRFHYQLSLAAAMFATAAEARAQLVRDLPYYSVLSTFACSLLQRHPWGTLAGLTSSEAKSVASLDTLLDAEFTRILQEAERLAIRRDADLSLVANCEDISKSFLGLAESTRFQTDRRRLVDLGRIASDIGAYLAERDYMVKERQAKEIEKGLERYVAAVRDQPTRLSVEFLLPTAKNMQAAIRADFEEYEANSPVRLDVRNVLSNDYCLLDRDNRVNVAVCVASHPGGAPVEALTVVAAEHGGVTMEEPAVSPELLRGGETRELTLAVKPSARQIEDRAFTLHCAVRYRRRDGKQMEQTGFALPVRLGTADEFVPVGNPYEAGAGGKPVDNPTMFKGREELLTRLAASLAGPGSGQCFVLYGQKRCGKTSVLRQLRHRLQKPVLAVEVTVGCLDVSRGENHNFYQILLDRTTEELDRLGIQVPLGSWPLPDQVRLCPSESMRKAFLEVLRHLRNSGWEAPKIVLLIDEFTYIYEYIKEGLLSSIFMRQWKSLLQLGAFDAVLVGQDSMPKFKQEYPNEFGVTSDERITYLSREAAAALAEQPILLDGRTRYRGHALDRLLEYTACSPFYTQMLCDRLVRHLNSRRAPFITEADVEIAVDGMVSGPEALPPERFDPLITAAGESVAEASREVYLELLHAVASASRQGSGALISDLPPVPEKERLLRDMQDRDVIMTDAANRVRIRVGLFTEWLRYQGGLIQSVGGGA